jgi:hypothetical protein
MRLSERSLDKFPVFVFAFLGFRRGYVVVTHDGGVRLVRGGPTREVQNGGGGVMVA